MKLNLILNKENILIRTILFSIILYLLIFTINNFFIFTNLYKTTSNIIYRVIIPLYLHIIVLKIIVLIEIYKNKYRYLFYFFVFSSISLIGSLNEIINIHNYGKFEYQYYIYYSLSVINIILLILFLFRFNQKSSFTKNTREILYIKSVKKLINTSHLVFTICTLPLIIFISLLIVEDLKNILSISNITFLFPFLPIILIYIFWIISLKNKSNFIMTVYLMVISYAVIYFDKILTLYINSFKPHSPGGFINFSSIEGILSKLMLIGYLILLLLGGIIISKISKNKITENLKN